MNVFSAIYGVFCGGFACSKPPHFIEFGNHRLGRWRYPVKPVYLLPPLLSGESGACRLHPRPGFGADHRGGPAGQPVPGGGPAKAVCSLFAGLTEREGHGHSVIIVSVLRVKQGSIPRHDLPDDFQSQTALRRGFFVDPAQCGPVFAGEPEIIYFGCAYPA